MKIKYIGLRNKQFQYAVELNGHEFSYFTGIGWVYFGRSNPDTAQYAALSSMEAEEAKASSRSRYDDYATHVFRKIPSEADVFECLQGDVEAGQMSFDEFCDNFGYSNDSLKALDVYRACSETAKKLRGFKFPERKDK